MKKELKKGCYQYFKKLKLYDLMMIGIIGGVLVVLLVGGYLYYHTIKNIITPFSMVLVLPLSRYLVNFILIFRCKSLEPKLNEEVDLILKDREEKILKELAFTIKEGIYLVDALFAIDGNLLVYISKPVSDYAGEKEYIKKIIAQSYMIRKLTFVTQEEEFLKRLKAILKLEVEDRDKAKKRQADLYEYLKGYII